MLGVIEVEKIKFSVQTYEDGHNKTGEIELSLSGSFGKLLQEVAYDIADGAEEFVEELTTSAGLAEMEATHHGGLNTIAEEMPDGMGDIDVTDAVGSEMPEEKGSDGEEDDGDNFLEF